MNPEELKSQISQVVDLWVSDILRSKFLQKPDNQERRSLWDKFKQGMTNWWWGRNGEKYNPYRWRNRFGDELGVSESFDPAVFTLNEYKNIKTLVDSVEVGFNESEEGFDNLRLMQIVRSAAERLKEMLFDALRGRVQAAEQPAQGAPSAERPPQSRPSPRTGLVQDPKATSGGSGESSDGGQEGAMGLVKASAVGSTEADLSSRPKRKSDRAKIEDGAREVAAMPKSELKPEATWLNLKNQVKKEKLPHVIAWMAMKSHKNPLDDEEIKGELQLALGKKVDLGIRGAGKIKLKSYLQQVLDDKFEKMMSLLGVEVAGSIGSAAREPAKRTNPRTVPLKAPKKTPEKKEPENSKPAADPVSEPPAREPKQEPEGGDDDQLKGYLYEGDRPKTINSVMSLLRDFVKQIGHERNKVDDVRSWWSSEIKRLEGIPKADKFEYLEAAILGSGEYVDAIAKAVGMSSGDLRNKMKDFLGSEGAASKTTPSDEKTADEVDESLGIDSYLMTDGKPHGLERTLNLIGRFMNNPMALINVGQDDARVRRLAEWWDREKESISKNSDPMGYIKKSLTEDKSWFKSVGEILGKSPDFVKNIMASHIKRKSNR